MPSIPSAAAAPATARPAASAPAAPPGRATGWLLGAAPFLTQFDLTAVVAAGPPMSAALGLDLPGFARVMDAYSVAFTASLLAAGHWVDRAGARRALWLGNLVFTLASLACGLAVSAAMLWLARAAQGIGAALVVTAAIACVPRLYDDPLARARVFTAWGVLSGVAMAIGPAAGAWVAEFAGWRWIFLLNGPAGLVLAALLARLPRDTPRPTASGRAIDGASLVLLSALLVCGIEALLALRHGVAAALGWGVAGTLAALLLRWRQRRRPAPLLAPGLFADPAVAALAALLAALSIGYWTLLVFLPPTLGVLLGAGVAESGRLMLAATLPFLGLPLLAPALLRRVGWRRFFAAGMAGVALGAALMAAALAGPPAAPWRGALFVAGMLLTGCGAALVHPQLSGAIVARVPPQHSGAASSFTVLLRQGGFAIGIAAFGALLGAQPQATELALAHALAAAAALLGVAAALRLPR